MNKLSKKLKDIVLIIVVSAVMWNIFCFLFFKFVVLSLPCTKPVNDICNEINNNILVDGIISCYQIDDYDPVFNIVVRLKNGLIMDFDYVRRKDGKLIFQDVLHVNNFVPYYYYKKENGHCDVSRFASRYLYPSLCIDDWLENSEMIYEKLLQLPLVEFHLPCTENFFNNLPSDYEEEVHGDIRKYLRRAADFPVKN